LLSSSLSHSAMVSDIWPLTYNLSVAIASMPTDLLLSSSLSHSAMVSESWPLTWLLFMFSKKVYTWDYSTLHLDTN